MGGGGAGAGATGGVGGGGTGGGGAGSGTALATIGGGGVTGAGLAAGATGLGAGCAFGRSGVEAGGRPRWACSSAAGSSTKSGSPPFPSPTIQGGFTPTSAPRTRRGAATQPTTVQTGRRRPRPPRTV